MDPATQLALVAGIIGAVMAMIAMANTALMFWLNSMKEKRLDKRSKDAEDRADARAIDAMRTTKEGSMLVASKVTEVKDVANATAKVAAQHVEEVKQAADKTAQRVEEVKQAAVVQADRMISETAKALESQTEELKAAVANGVTVK